MQVGDYSLTFEEIDASRTEEKLINAANIAVAKNGESIGTMSPQRNLHLAQQQTQSEVSIRTTPIEDLYLVVTAIDPNGDIVLRAFVNPLTWWIWMGAAVMAAGMSVILSGGAAEAATSTASARVREPAVATR